MPGVCQNTLLLWKYGRSRFFFAAVFLGSYVQGITGFALGVVVMAIVGAAPSLDVNPYGGGH
ncbi:MAG: hypothetical protein Ct9H300mP8_03580 [Gammaproteobacteria bacterium]|nr:MAG: hypothetical protein Ct9H300mP8_03580 [Gammaproteobacteria bacterium]